MKQSTLTMFAIAAAAVASVLIAGAVISAYQADAALMRAPSCSGSPGTGGGEGGGCGAGNVGGNGAGGALGGGQQQREKL